MGQPRGGRRATLTKRATPNTATASGSPPAVTSPCLTLDTQRDGLVRDIDCEFLLHGSLGEPLKDPAYFRQVRVDDELRTIAWPNGLDPAPELLHGDYSPARAITSASRRAAA